MFGWLSRPTCPCDVSAKNWVEQRLAWLCNEFDDHAFNGRPLVLPTAEFFPDRYTGTRLRKPEYMTPPMYGYALAHLAWFRGERTPVWGRHLHLNARPSFKQGLRFLFETRDSTFRPKRFR